MYIPYVRKSLVLAVQMRDNAWCNACIQCLHMNSAEGFALIITLWRHKQSLKLVYAKTLSAKTLKLVLAINSNLKVCVCVRVRVCVCVNGWKA